MENKELIVVGSAFAFIAAVSMYMFINQNKNNNSVIETGKLKADYEQRVSLLEQDLAKFKQEVKRIDSIYHKAK